MESVRPLLDGAVKAGISAAHRVPYGYGDKAVEIATNLTEKYLQDSEARAALQARALELNRIAVARGEQLSVYPDWCDHGSRLIAYTCEQYLDSPIWCTVFILDGIALWLIFCILRRQREQNQEDLQARKGQPRSVRMRRLWGRLRAAVKTASMNAKTEYGSSSMRGESSEHWKKAFEEVAKARDHRKKYLWKKDYDLMGVMGRGMGPVIMVFCTTLISFETHSWYTLVLPSFGLPPRCFLFVAALTAVVPFRIFLDYFRTSFTDPGSPQAYSPRGSNVVACSDCDIEIGGQASSEVKKCHKCGGPKPLRCHHCKVCRRCVLKMDHHCPFVNNCVGLRNHRFFILFLLELVIGCSVLVACLLPQLLVSLRGGPHQTLANRIHVITTFAVALIADSMLSPFFYYHMQLVIVNETTLENMKSRNQRMEHKMKQKQLERNIQRAEKNGDEPKLQEFKVELAALNAKEEVRRAAAKEEHARYSQGSFMANFTEVFGAPPAAWRKHVEAVLEWFNPAKTVKPAKTRSA